MRVTVNDKHLEFLLGFRLDGVPEYRDIEVRHVTENIATMLFNSKPKCLVGPCFTHKALGIEPVGRGCASLGYVMDRQTNIKRD